MSNEIKPWQDTERLSGMIARMESFQRTGDEILALPVTLDCPEEERCQ